MGKDSDHDTYIKYPIFKIQYLNHRNRLVRFVDWTRNM